MFWILKRLFWLAIFAAVIYFGANYRIDGRPVKDYAKEFYRSPLVQAALKTGKEIVMEFFDEKVGSRDSEQVPKDDTKEPDNLTHQDQQQLEKILKQETR